MFHLELGTTIWFWFGFIVSVFRYFLKFDGTRTGSHVPLSGLSFIPTLRPHAGPIPHCTAVWNLVFCWTCNRRRSGSTPTHPHHKWSFMCVHGRKLGLLCRILGGFLVETSETSGGMWRKRLQCGKATTGAPPIPDFTADGHIMISSGFKLQTNHAAS